MTADALISDLTLFLLPVASGALYVCLGRSWPRPVWLGIGARITHRGFGQRRSATSGADLIIMGPFDAGSVFCLLGATWIGEEGGRSRSSQKPDSGLPNLLTQSKRSIDFDSIQPRPEVSPAFSHTHGHAHPPRTTRSRSHPHNTPQHHTQTETIINIITSSSMRAFLPVVLALLALLALAQAFVVPRAAPLPTKAAVAVRAEVVAPFVKRCVDSASPDCWCDACRPLRCADCHCVWC